MDCVRGESHGGLRTAQGRRRRRCSGKKRRGAGKEKKTNYVMILSRALLTSREEEGNPHQIEATTITRCFFALFLADSNKPSSWNTIRREEKKSYCNVICISPQISVTCINPFHLKSPSSNETKKNCQRKVDID